MGNCSSFLAIGGEFAARGHRLAVIATVALVAIAGAVGLAFITSNRGEPEERREDPPRPVAVVAADAAPPAPTAIETPPPAPEQIRLTIRSEPSGAVGLDSVTISPFVWP